LGLDGEARDKIVIMTGFKAGVVFADRTASLTYSPLLFISLPFVTRAEVIK